MENTMRFNTKIHGIPCICEVLAYRPNTPTWVYGPAMEDAYPPEEGEFEYRILDRKGYSALWLEALITPDVEEQLLEEIQVLHEAEYRDYAESAAQAAAEEMAF